MFFKVSPSVPFLLSSFSILWSLSNFVILYPLCFLVHSFASLSDFSIQFHLYVECAFSQLFTDKNFPENNKPSKRVYNWKISWLPCSTPWSTLFSWKNGKGYFFRCKLINPWVDYLLINPFSIDQPNQPSYTEFIIIYKKPTIWGLIRLINGKRVYQEIINPWVYQFATKEIPFSVFFKKKGLIKG